MKAVPEGTWVSESSDITGYIPGAEWLEFLDGGRDHVWKLRQPVGELWMRRFRLEEKDGDSIFTAIEKDGVSTKSWPIEFSVRPDDRLAVSHHGFTTIFKRATTRGKKEPNQPLQRNASTGSVSNFESPARRG
jgi:hypothetical protein